MIDGASPALHACSICGLQQTVGVVPSGARVHCARCDHLLFQDRAGEENQRVFSFSLTALLLFIPANLYPILEVTSFGNTRSYTVLSGARALWDGSMWPLAIPVALASVVLPFCLIIALLSLAMAEGSGLPATTRRFLRRAAEFLSVWSIVDVYLLAIFVTVVKLAQMTDAAPTGGALVFFGMVLSLSMALRSLGGQGVRPLESLRQRSSGQIAGSPFQVI
jgi:paraquat-inducible protein A